MNSTVSERLRWLRSQVVDNNGEPLSRRELARLAGLNDRHVSKIESRGGEHIEGKTAVALAGVFGISVEWLVSGTGFTPTAAQLRAAVKDKRTVAA